MTEALVAMQVEREPLEEPSHVKDPVTSPFEHLHAVVEALHKPAGLPTLEIVRDLIDPPLERPQKALELGQPAGTRPLTPGPNRTLGPRLRIVALEQLGQVFPQVVGRLDQRALYRMLATVLALLDKGGLASHRSNGNFDVR